MLVVVVYISLTALLAGALRSDGCDGCDGCDGLPVTYAEFLNITGRQRAPAV